MIEVNESVAENVKEKVCNATKDFFEFSELIFKEDWVSTKISEERKSF